MEPLTNGHHDCVVPNGDTGKDEDAVPTEDPEKLKERQRFLQSIINNQCTVCKIVFSSFTYTMQHVRGKRHQDAVRTCKDSSIYTLERMECETLAVQGDNDASPSGFTMDPNSWFRCAICDVVCSSLGVAGSHAAGKKHRQQELILDLRKKKESMVSSPKDIELSRPGSPDEATYSYEVLRDGKTTMNVTVTNRSEKDVLNLEYGLLKHIAVVNLQRTSKISNIMPGKIASVNISIQGRHLGTYSSALVFNFTWKSQPGNCLRVVRQLRICCTDDTVKQLQVTTEYKRPVRMRFERPGEVVEGYPLPKASSGQLEREVRLDQFPVPQNLSHLHNKGMEEWDGMDSKLQPQLNEYRDLLKSVLTASNHHERFSLLLHCAEVQMHVDIRNYDMRGVMLTRCRENPRLLTLKVPGLAENRPSVMRGDCLFVTSCDAEGQAVGDKEFKGYVHNTRLEEVWLGFHQSFLNSFVEKSKFSVRFSVNRLPTQMNHRSVILAHDYMNDVLFPTKDTAATWRGTSQGSSEPILQNASEHFKDRQLLSNAEQVAAVCSIVAGLSRPAPYLVFGPPGTGKTVTIVESMKQVLRVVPSAHIMACAPSNSAADLLTERLLLHVPATQMFRLNAASRSLATMPACIKPCSNIDRLSGAMYYPSKKDLMQYKIIITTLVTAGRIVSARFPSSHFSHVFIDEAGHAVEPEALIAIAGIIECRHYNGAQVVLAGDPKQLGPVIRSPTAKEYGLEMSLIERYMSTCDVYKRRDDGTYDTRLLTKLVCNYRSHPSILELPNSCFYDGELKPFADTLLRESLCSWEWLPKKGFPLIFHGVVGQDMREETSPSFFNPTEVSIVMDYVTKLLDTKRNKVKQTDIGIISPYRKQVQKIQRMLRERNHGDVKAGSVEEFQGQERRVIIISTVRSNPEFLTLDKEYNLGFLDNPKRFNVAITRAKALLVIVGNPKILSKDKYWQQLLRHCSSHGAYTGVELVDDDTATDDMLQRFTDMQLDDIDKDGTVVEGGEGDVSVMTRHEDPEWRNEI